MKKLLFILLLVTSINGFSQPIKRDVIRATNSLICDLYFIYRNDTVDFTFPELDFAVDTNNFHTYPLSSDNFMRVTKSIYPSFILPDWGKVKDTISYYVKVSSLKDSIQAEMDTLFYYLMVKDSLIKYVTPKQLSDSMSNVMAGLDTINTLVTKHYLDSVIQAIGIDTTIVRNIAAQVVRDTFNVATLNDTLTIIGTKKEIQAILDSLSSYSKKTNGFIGFADITTTTMSITYDGEMSSDNYWFDLKAYYDVVEDGKNIKKEIAVYDYSKDKNGFTASFVVTGGTLQYMAFDTTGVTLSTGGFIETDPIYSVSVAHGITGADTSNWNDKIETETDPVFNSSVAHSITGTDTTRWNDKLSTETDPVFTAHLAYDITALDTARWGSGLVNFTETDPTFTAHLANDITATDTTNWGLFRSHLARTIDSSDTTRWGAIQTTVTGNAGSATQLQTSRNIYGNAFNGTADLDQVIASTYGGTGNGFTKFSGPATSEKIFTLPNSSATLLYSGGALGTPTSGTLTNCTFPTLNQNTTGSAGSIKMTSTTGLMTVTGATAGTTRAKTIRDANDTFLELGGSYTPTGTWNWQTATVTWPTFNQNTTGSAATLTTARTIAGNSFNGSANVAFTNKFIVQGTTDAGLTGAQFLGSLGTGIVKNTTTTGVLSIASAGVDYAPATSGTSILKGNGSGGFTNAVSGTDYGPAFSTSSGLASIVSDETGSGALVFGTSPTLTTPTLGAATATSINKLTITQPATSAILTIANGSTLATSGAYSITLTSTATTNVTLPTTGTLATTNDLANKIDKNTSQTLSISSGTVTMGYDLGADAYLLLTGNVSSFSITDLVAGAEGNIILQQNATGGYSITDANGILTTKTEYWQNGLKPTSSNINTLANAITRIHYKVWDTNILFEIIKY